MKEAKEFLMVACKLIKLNTEYVRFQALEESSKAETIIKLNELAKNIKAIGLMNPITLMPNDDGKTFTVVAGNRRFVAVSQILKWNEVPAHIMEGDNFALSFSENIQREPLTDVERGEWLSKAVEYMKKQAPYKNSKTPVTAIMDTLSKQLQRKPRTLMDWIKLAKNVTPQERHDIKTGKAKASKVAKGKQKERVATGKAKTKKTDPLKNKGKFFAKTEASFLKISKTFVDTLAVINSNCKEFHQRPKVVKELERVRKALAITERYFSGVSSKKNRTTEKPDMD